MIEFQGFEVIGGNDKSGVKLTISLNPDFQYLNIAND
jgi:hypothetical protein